MFLIPILCIQNSGQISKELELLCHHITKNGQNGFTRDFVIISINVDIWLSFVD